MKNKTLINIAVVLDIITAVILGLTFSLVCVTNDVAVAVPEQIIFSNLKEETYTPPVIEEPEVVETEIIEEFVEEEIIEEPIQEEVYVEPEPQYEYYESVYYEEPVQSQSVSIGNDFQSDGRWNDGQYDYTWYSSNVLYHYRTSEWTAGEDGIYRDADGYVVVASSDLEQGSVVEDTPFGAAKVYDSGCASGTLDVYVNW